MLRAAGIVASLVVCAWFAVGVVQADAVGEAQRLLTSTLPPGPADARRTEAALDRAGFLNPDSRVGALRASFAVQRRRPQAARRIELGIVRREPANAEVWAAIALLARGQDRALERRATARLRRLVPLSG